MKDKKDVKVIALKLEEDIGKILLGYLKECPELISTAEYVGIICEFWMKIGIKLIKEKNLESNDKAIQQVASTFKEAMKNEAINFLEAHKKIIEYLKQQEEQESKKGSETAADLRDPGQPVVH